MKKTAQNDYQQDILTPVWSPSAYLYSLFNGDMCAKIAGVKLPKRLNFVRWRLICVGPQYSSCFMSPLLARISFMWLLDLLENLCTPSYQYLNLHKGYEMIQESARRELSMQRIRLVQSNYRIVIIALRSSDLLLYVLKDNHQIMKTKKNVKLYPRTLHRSEQPNLRPVRFTRRKEHLIPEDRQGRSAPVSLAVVAKRYDRFFYRKSNPGCPTCSTVTMPSFLCSACL